MEGLAAPRFHLPAILSQETLIQGITLMIQNPVPQDPMLETLVRVCREQAERLDTLVRNQEAMFVKIDRLEIILGQPDRLKDIKKQARAERDSAVDKIVDEHYHTI